MVGDGVMKDCHLHPRHLHHPVCLPAVADVAGRDHGLRMVECRTGTKGKWTQCALRGLYAVCGHMHVLYVKLRQPGLVLRLHLLEPQHKPCLL